MGLSSIEKKLEKASKAVSDILTRPKEDPIWADEEFWEKKWPKIVDNESNLREQFAEEFLKSRQKQKQEYLKHAKLLESAAMGHRQIAINLEVKAKLERELADKMFG